MKGIYTLQRNHLQGNHIGEKPSICKDCGKSYTNRIHLKIHIDEKHKQIRHQCVQCGQDFTRRHTLTAQIENVHEEVPKVKRDVKEAKRIN